MNRRSFLTGLGAVLAAPLGAEAQQAGKVYPIGVSCGHADRRSGDTIDDRSPGACG